MRGLVDELVLFPGIIGLSPSQSQIRELHSSLLNIVLQHSVDVLVNREDGEVDLAGTQHLQYLNPLCYLETLIVQHTQTLHTHSKLFSLRHWLVVLDPGSES